MRFLTRSVPTARFPALPRRLSILVMLTLMVSGLVIAPLLINVMLRVRMNEAVQQAIMLAQISHMHEFEGRRPEVATRALPLVGFEIATAEASKPMLTWLVVNPSPRASVRTVNLVELSQWQTTSLVWWIMTCPPDAVFAVTNRQISGGHRVTALTTTGLFQANVIDAAKRISVTVFVSSLILAGLALCRAASDAERTG